MYWTRGQHVGKAPLHQGQKAPYGLRSWSPGPRTATVYERQDTDAWGSGKARLRRALPAFRRRLQGQKPPVRFRKPLRATLRVQKYEPVGVWASCPRYRGPSGLRQGGEGGFQKEPARRTLMFRGFQRRGAA
jgi:hypothetical protein